MLIIYRFGFGGKMMNTYIWGNLKLVLTGKCWFFRIKLKKKIWSIILTALVLCAKVMDFYILKAAEDTENYYAVRPECKEDVQKARFKPKVGLLMFSCSLHMLSYVRILKVWKTLHFLFLEGISNTISRIFCQTLLMGFEFLAVPSYLFFACTCIICLFALVSYACLLLWQC